MLTLILTGLCYFAWLNGASWKVYTLFCVVAFFIKLQQEIQKYQLISEYMDYKNKLFKEDKPVIEVIKNVATSSDTASKVSIVDVLDADKIIPTTNNSNIQ